MSGAALIGGETAEMPGFYPIDEYDLAGYCTGIVDKEKIIDNKTMCEGDVVIALASSGVHSNGFSLVRKVFDVENADLKKPIKELNGKSIGEALLTPTKIYVKSVLALLEKVKVKGISHITGGGFYENIPRMLKDGQGVEINVKSFPRPKIFDLIMKTGNIDEKEMYNVFNMGIGFIMAVEEKDVDLVLAKLNEINEPAYVIGKVTNSGEVDLKW